MERGSPEMPTLGIGTTALSPELLISATIKDLLNFGIHNTSDSFEVVHPRADFDFVAFIAFACLLAVACGAYSYRNYDYNNYVAPYAAAPYVAAPYAAAPYVAAPSVAYRSYVNPVARTYVTPSYSVANYRTYSQYSPPEQYGYRIAY
ncbi:unnamed protein product [Cyprideis torosa]|uniref:Uncharacterized protein n=1 Tax=Cyprideis torosa TaxID=163714 RepID=A0A7R8W0Y5_9CRUS|nr:unnamed protein product [Cyprideis torosa]CAG0880288.1 unnamed protein product [Cyprideis torosa]